MYHSRLAFVRVYHSPHRVVDGALVKVFVCVCLVAVLVSHSHQQQSPLPTVDCDLPDDLVEALVEELLSHGAQPYLPCLPIDQPFVELLVQLNDLYLRGWGRQDCLDPQLPVVGPVFFRRKNFPKDVLSMVGLLVFLCLLAVARFASPTQQDGS